MCGSGTVLRHDETTPTHGAICCAVRKKAVINHAASERSAQGLAGAAELLASLDHTLRHCGFGLASP